VIVMAVKSRREWVRSGNDSLIRTAKPAQYSFWQSTADWRHQLPAHSAGDGAKAARCAAAVAAAYLHCRSAGRRSTDRGYF